MRILFIAPLPDPVTGQSLACKVLLDELVKDHVVDVIDLSKGGFKQGVNSFQRILSVLRIVRDAARLQKSADIIYLTVAESYAGNVRDLSVYSVCFPRLNSLVIHLHGGAGLRDILLGKRTLLRWVNEFFLRRLGGAVVLGETHTAVVKNAIPKHRVHIVPNFAEPYLLATAEEVGRKFENAEPLRVLFLSNLLPGKGFLELLDAYLAMNPHAQKRLVIDFAGGFESAAHEVHFHNRTKDRGSIRYHGIVHGEQKRRLFHQAHVFCLPTYYPYEGQPISILEAYASGCAVIATDHSGIRDIFADRVNGYEVEKKSSMHLRTILENIIGREQELLAMALTNLEDARVKYQASRYNRDLLRIFCEVARSTPNAIRGNTGLLAKSTPSRSESH